MRSARPRRECRIVSAGVHAASRWVAEQLESRVLLSAVAWTGGGDGLNWTDPSNWSAHALPGPADDVTINAAAGLTIQLQSQNSAPIHSLISNAPLEVAGTLSIATTAQLSANITLDGVLGGGTLNFTGGANIVIGSGFFTASLGGTVNGNIDATADSIFTIGGLTLNGTMFLGNSSGTTFGRVAIGQADTLDGTGSIVFGGSSLNEIVNQSQAANGTVTIGPNFTIHGANGSIQNLNSALFPGEQLVNRGTIDADTAGGTISVPSFLTNQGLIEATAGAVTLASADNQAGATLAADGGTLTQTGQFNDEGLAHAINGGTLNLNNLINAAGATVDADGSTLALSGFIHNSGTISETNSTLTLAGDFSQADLGTLVRSGGTIKVTGHVHGDVTLDANTGSWDVEGATLDGGTIHLNGVPAVFGPAGTTLIDSTFNGDIDLSRFNNANITIIGSLTLNGTLFLGNASGTTSGAVFFGPGAKSFADSTLLGAEAAGFQQEGHIYLGNSVVMGHATVVLGGRSGFGNALINNTLIARGPLGSGGDFIPPALSFPGPNGSTRFAKGGNLKFGPDVVIRGGIGSAYNQFNEGTIENDGLIIVDGANAAMLIGGSPLVGVQANVFNNFGSIQITNSAAVSIDGLVNMGTIAANAAALVLTGSFDDQSSITATNSLVDLKASFFTQAQLGNFINAGSTVQRSGSINGGLTLDATTGSWLLHGGTVSGGTLAETGGAELIPTSFGGTLNSVTVNGDLDLDQVAGATLQIFNGLTLNGTMFVGNAQGSVVASVLFGGRSAPDTTLSGNGSIVLGIANDSLLTQGGSGFGPGV